MRSGKSPEGRRGTFGDKERATLKSVSVGPCSADVMLGANTVTDCYAIEEGDRLIAARNGAEPRRSL